MFSILEHRGFKLNLEKKLKKQEEKLFGLLIKGFVVRMSDYNLFKKLIFEFQRQKKNYKDFWMD